MNSFPVRVFLATFWLLPIQEALSFSFPFSGKSDKTAVRLKLPPEAEQRSDALTHFAWGLYLQQQNPENTENYIDEFRKALEILPSSEPVLRAFSAPLLAREEYQQLIDQLQPIAKRNPEITRLQLLLTEALKKQGDVEAAVAHLKNVLRKRSSASPGIVRQLASYYWEQEEYEKALKVYRRRLRRRTAEDNVRLWLSAARFHYSRLRQIEKEDPEDAPHEVAWYEDRARRQARHAARLVKEQEEIDLKGDRLLELSQLLQESGEWKILASLGQLPLQQYKDNIRGRLYLFCTEAFLQLENSSQAVAYLQKINDLNNVSRRVRYRQASLYVRANHPRKAIDLYKDQLSEATDKDPILMTLARLHLQIEKPEKAREFANACTGVPVHKHYLISRSYRQQKKYRQALDELRKVRKAAENSDKDKQDESISEVVDAYFYMYYATLAEKLGNIKLALKKAYKAREKAPDDPVTANFLGYLLADHNRQLDKAAELIREAVSAEPENAAYTDSLAWVHYRKGHNEAALRNILKALRLSRGRRDAVILHHAGDICLTRDLDILAECYLWQALNGEPEDPEAIKGKLEKLGAETGAE